ncbi:MAG: 2-dehydropantoate 2-reductase [Chloroflexota bacterium]|nr:2-dehydropantoate 2-reductase [Chloroflexota bacterium]
MSKRSIVIFGAGAVGGYLGAKLGADAAATADLTLLGRARTAQAVAEHGLILHELDRDQVTHPRIVTSVEALPPCDLILLAVRTYDVVGSIDDLRMLLGKHGLVLALQNGVGSEEELARALGHHRVLPGTLTVSAGMEQPGSITRYSHAGGLALSTMDGRSVPSWLVELLSATGLPTITVADYRSLRWSKLLLNMLGAATSAILDMDIGSIMSDRRLFRIEQLAFREATRLMRAEGIGAAGLPGYAVPQARLAMRLPRSLAQATLGRRIAQARGGRSPGMRADMMRGKTEIAAFNGAAVQAGRQHHIPTPVNAALTDLVLDLATHPERRDQYRDHPEALVAYLGSRGVRV